MAITPPSRRRRIGDLLFKAFAILIALPLLYLSGGALGSAIPANPGWEEAEDGVTIFVRTNGVHTWLMVPTLAEGVDWRPLADPGHIPNPLYAGDYIAFGYGNRDFYLNTPTWADLTVPTALAAAFGQGPALMHVDHVWHPRSDEFQRPVRLSPDQYRLLAAHIRQGFDLDAAGRPIPLLGRGYGPSDVFYEGRGLYNLARTCNEWTGEGLRAAGVRTGIWTPFASGIMWRL